MVQSASMGNDTVSVEQFIASVLWTRKLCISEQNTTLEQFQV